MATNSSERPSASGYGEATVRSSGFMVSMSLPRPARVG